MIRTILAIAVAGFAAAPAFAMDDMSCTDFTAMDSAGRAKALMEMEEMDGGMITGGGMTAATGAGDMAPEDAVAALTATCAQHPEMMLGEAMGMAPE
jgi:hypothetical protein